MPMMRPVLGPDDEDESSSSLLLLLLLDEEEEDAEVGDVSVAAAEVALVVKGRRGEEGTKEGVVEGVSRRSGGEKALEKVKAHLVAAPLAVRPVDAVAAAVTADVAAAEAVAPAAALTAPVVIESSAASVSVGSSANVDDAVGSSPSSL